MRSVCSDCGNNWSSKVSLVSAAHAKRPNSSSRSQLCIDWRNDEGDDDADADDRMLRDECKLRSNNNEICQRTTISFYFLMGCSEETKSVARGAPSKNLRRTAETDPSHPPHFFVVARLASVVNHASAHNAALVFHFKMI